MCACLKIFSSVNFTCWKYFMRVGRSVMAATTKKPKQMTLFGKRAIPEPYYKNANMPYQKFVNKQWIENESEYGKNKQDFEKYVNKEWHKYENDHEWLDKYLSDENIYQSVTKVSKKGFFTTNALDSNLHSDDNDEVVITGTAEPTPSSSSCSMNPPRILSDDAEFLSSYIFRVVGSFL